MGLTRHAPWACCQWQRHYPDKARAPPQVEGGMALEQRPVREAARARRHEPQENAGQ
jgi:hypothetical protein